MADRYWFGGNGNWINAATRFCNSPPVCFTASTSGTTMTVTAGGTNLAIGMTVYTVGAGSVGVITGGANPTWTMSVSSTLASTTMYAGIADTAPASTDVVYLGGVYAAGSVTGVATAVTIALTGTVSCSGIVVGNAAPITVGSTSGTLNLLGDLNIAAGTIWSATVPLSFSSSLQVSTNGVSLGSSITVSGASGDTCQLASALTISSLIITSGTFTTNNYNVTATQLSSSNSNTRTINLGSSTVTLTSNSGWGCSTSTNLTVNAATSSIILSATSPGFDGGSRTYNDVSFTSTALASPVIGGGNTFNNLSFAGRTTAGIAQLAIFSNQTINGTLTLSAGTNATMRTFVRSNTLGTTRTLTCAAVASLTDIDFRDITIAGAAVSGGNLTGTRLGDCKGNSGITFPAAKTVYWRATPAGGNWGTDSWSLTLGGAYTLTAFPLAQDTAVFANYPNTGQTVTVNAAYNIGTIDMSARTSNTMTLSCAQSPAIYGNWINGTGTTLTGTGVMAFAGRGSQTITSSGKTFTQSFTISAFGGSVTLLDAFVSNRSATSAFLVITGTFDANGYAFTLSGASSRFDCSGGSARTIALGSGAWTIAGSATAWNANNATNLTVTGTGTISLTSASAKTFEGGGIQTYPTLNQGGTGALTISGSNKFANITNTAIGSVLFTGGTTNEFTAFNLNGTSTAARLTLGSTNTTRAILKKPSTWYMGTGSLDNGNNTGLTFTAGGGIDYLSVSYINGQVTTPAVTYAGNFFAFF